MPDLTRLPPMDTANPERQQPKQACKICRHVHRDSEACGLVAEAGRRGYEFVEEDFEVARSLFEYSAKFLVGGSWSSTWIDAVGGTVYLYWENVPASDTAAITSEWDDGEPFGNALKRIYAKATK